MVSRHLSCIYPLICTYCCTEFETPLRFRISPRKTFSNSQKRNNACMPEVRVGGGIVEVVLRAIKSLFAAKIS
jgi:hypothetical protein